MQLNGVERDLPDFAKATTDKPGEFSPARIAPTRPEVGFHLSVRGTHQQNDCSTE